jgi:formate-dependent nitrite reductase membrane component NrfD
MIETTVTRHSAEPLIWGWQVPVDLFLAGAAAGIIILTLFVSRRIAVERQSRWMRLAPFGAPLLLSGAMLALLLDLETKAHAFRFYTTLRITSPMSWGAWILLATFGAALLLGIARIRGGASQSAPLAIAAGAAALGLAGYPGALLCSLNACAVWGSALLVPLFLASAIVTGGALLLLFPLAEAECRLLRSWVAGAIGAELILIGLYLFDLSTSGLRGQGAAALFLGGRATAAFWSLVVIAGLVVPAGFLLMELRRRLPPRLITPVLLLVGAFALRWIVVVSGQVS